MTRNFHCGRCVLNAGHPLIMSIISLADERGARIVRVRDIATPRDALVVVQALEEY